LTVFPFSPIKSVVCSTVQGNLFCSPLTSFLYRHWQCRRKDEKRSFSESSIR